MTYLIASLLANVNAANSQISSNMGLGEADEVTKAWDVPTQISAQSSTGLMTIPAHPIYTADPSKLGWWTIQKPEQRFMTGVSLTEVSV